MEGEDLRHPPSESEERKKHRALQAIKQGKKLNGSGITKVICSPFKRCIQTAAIVCKQIGVESITIHKGFGEQMSQIRKTCAAFNSKEDENDDYLVYMSPSEMLSAVHAIDPFLSIDKIE